CIADAIAKKIMANRTRKRFSSLYAEAIQETMPTPTSSTLNGPGTGQPRVSTQTTDDATVANEGQKASPANGSTGKNDVTSGMNVSSQVSVGAIKPTDSKTLEGSYAGDH